MGVFDNLLNKFKMPKEEESPRMKSAEAQKLTFAKLARKAQERTASDLSELSKGEPKKEDGDKPPLDDLLNGPML